MNTNLEKLDNNLFKLSVEIDTEIASQEYNKACKKFGANLAIPGFRKGKAPRSIVEKHIGFDKIKRKAIDVMLPPVLADVISEHQLDLIAEPTIESYNYELGKPANITVKIEVKPEFDLPKYKGQVVEVPEFKQEENALEKQLEYLSNKFTTLEEVVDRETQDKDIVFIDFSGKIGEESIKGGTGKNQQLDLSNSHFIPGFAEQLVGKKIGEEFKIKVTFPEDYQDKNIAGKEAEFTIKINEIKKKVAPELDDEFARKIGPFNTMDDLKADLQNYLDKSRESENRIRAEKAIVEKIVEDTKLDPPDTMTNREAKYLMEEVEKNFRNQGISWEKVLEEQGYEKTWNNLRQEAARRVKITLILGEIAKKENIQLTEEDFAQKVRQLASSYNVEEKAIYDQMSQNPAVAQGLSQQVMSQKIINYLLENNEVKYIEDTSA